jgi:hypothetical protein
VWLRFVHTTPNAKEKHHGLERTESDGNSVGRRNQQLCLRSEKIREGMPSLSRQAGWCLTGFPPDGFFV